MSRRVTDKQIRDAYAEHGSVHRAGEALGIHGGSFHERAAKLGIVEPINVFTDAERDRLRREYILYRDNGKLKELAAQMGRTKHFLCRQARALGLTKPDASRAYLRVWKGMSEDAARVWLEDYRTAGKSLSAFCRARGIDDLGFSRTMAEFFPAEYEALTEANAPTTSAYVRGRSFEYAAKKALTRCGYFVLRSPQSKSPTDLVAIAPGSVLMVQCRINGQLPPKDWNALYDLATSAGAAPVLAWREGTSRTRFAVMTGRKDGTRTRQPMIMFDPGQAVARPTQLGGSDV